MNNQNNQTINLWVCLLVNRGVTFNSQKFPKQFYQLDYVCRDLGELTSL